MDVLSACYANGVRYRKRGVGAAYGGATGVGGRPNQEISNRELTWTVVTQSELTHLQCWKNPVTGNLHFQVHPCGVRKLHIDPLPAGAKKEGALYPDGGEIDDLKEARDLLYKMQRPAIAPEVSFLSPSHYLAHAADGLPGRLGGRRSSAFPQPRQPAQRDWRFQARGAANVPPGKPSFWLFLSLLAHLWTQCNLASTDEPEGPSAEDVAKYA